MNGCAWMANYVLWFRYFVSWQVGYPLRKVLRLWETQRSRSSGLGNLGRQLDQGQEMPTLACTTGNVWKVQNKRRITSAAAGLSAPANATDPRLHSKRPERHEARQVRAIKRAPRHKRVKYAKHRCRLLLRGMG